MPAMATRKGGNSPEEEEEEEEEEGEGDVFFESFDRILSSSCSSTSASASDDESSSGRRRCRARLRFPPLSSLDVWSAEPISVKERRRLLLRHLGLSGDPTLARLPRSLGAHADVGMSIESGRFALRANPDAVALSPSPSSLGKSLPQQQFHVPIRSPPSRKPLSNGVLVVSHGHRRIDGEQPLCLIKNLDNGIEFVVKELREDGMWITLSEVGTGRELTVEEFDMCVGRSPIVQELLRRQNAKEATDCSDSSGSPGGRAAAGGRSTGGMLAKKRLSWFRNIKNVAETIMARGNGHSRRNIAEKYPSIGKGGRLSSLATEGSLEGSHGLHLGLERIKVRRCGKSHKELSDLYMCQEIIAHSGSIWSIRFSLDGQYLASAGEDCIIHVRKVSEFDSRDDLQNEKASEANEGNQWEKNSKAKILGSLKSSCSYDSPEYVFELSEKPVCSLQGHQDHILDLCWSKSKHLLSSSMDKTVRLWHMSSNSCLKVFSHSDYVTCIQFNPVDDRYFISGSLDGKVRIWSIPDHQVVDWNDLHEMVTAACYTPDGQGVLVGSNKGNCHLYDTSDNKVLQRSQIDLQIKKKKSRHKKVTGFQFKPGSSSKVIITSADSRIRVIDGDELVHKFKGFRNTSSQISASFTPNGNHVICASEDSRVCIWRYNDSRASRSKAAATVTRTYEDFHCHGVTVAVPWPNSSTANMLRTCPIKQHGLGAEPGAPSLVENNVNQVSPSIGAQQHSATRNSNSNRFSDRVSATWPEELMTSHKQSPPCNGSMMVEGSSSSWGLVIVTAGRGGEIKIFQNFLLSKSNMKSAAS